MSRWPHHLTFPTAMYEGLSCQYLLFSVFSIIDILVGMKWYLIVDLIYISLMTNDFEHLFMCSLAIYMSSLENGVFKSFAYLLIGLFFFYCWPTWIFIVVKPLGLVEKISQIFLLESLLLSYWCWIFENSFLSPLNCSKYCVLHFHHWFKGFH